MVIFFEPGNGEMTLLMLLFSKWLLIICEIESDTEKALNMWIIFISCCAKISCQLSSRFLPLIKDFILHLKVRSPSILWHSIWIMKNVKLSFGNAWIIWRMWRFPLEIVMRLISLILLLREESPSLFVMQHIAVFLT